MKKTLAIAGAMTAVGLSSLAGAGVVSAQGNQHFFVGQDDLVAKIAQKFDLSEDDVQKVFDENRSEHEAQFEQKIEDNMSQAVKDGKLTQDQADKLIAKHKEMKAYMESLKDKTPEEHRDAMKTKIDEFQQWAKDNKIPEEFTHMGFRIGGGPAGHDGPHAMIMHEDSSGSATATN